MNTPFADPNWNRGTNKIARSVQIKIMESNGKIDSSSIAPSATASSGIRDNYLRGAVGDFLLERIRDGSDLSVVSAYFTIYAFGALQKRLVEIDRMRFLFGDPMIANVIVVVLALLIVVRFFIKYGH